MGSPQSFCGTSARAPVHNDVQRLAPPDRRASKAQHSWAERLDAGLARHDPSFAATHLSAFSLTRDEVCSSRLSMAARAVASSRRRLRRSQRDVGPDPSIHARQQPAGFRRLE